MRSFAFVAAITAPLVLACDNPLHDACAAAITASSADAAPFCATYTQASNTEETGLPSWASSCSNKPKKISSACSCLSTDGAAATPAASSIVSVSYVPTTLQTSAYPTATAVAVSSVYSSAVAVSTAAAVTSVAPAVTSVASVADSVSVGGDGGTTCTVTGYADISSAVASCTNILLDSVSMPASSTLDLTALQTGTTVIFSGTTSFGYTEDSDFDPIVVKGDNIKIVGAEGSVIDGNGAAYWDGEGSNGGSDKPDHFFVVKDVTNGVFENLYIQNYPVHCFDITGGDTITMTGITLDNSAGDEPNDASGDDPAGHNTDGFDISSTSNLVLSNSIVKNQDDCVAITSGSNITVNGMTCSGGHGLSIGSVGGKSNNDVSDITFSSSTVTDSENGCRIKSNADTTGSISNIVYKDIILSGISDYGIDIQQDYKNGGATGEPTNGVTIDTVTFDNVTGDVGDDAYNMYILCGSDSCSGFTFTGVGITGGDSSCNYPSTTCAS